MSLNLTLDLQLLTPLAEIYNRRGIAPVLAVLNSNGEVLLTVPAHYWRNLGMITPFSTDLQYWRSTVGVMAV